MGHRKNPAGAGADLNGSTPARALAYTRSVVNNPSASLVSGYRGRLAPSPTGYLHIGHARTFWAAFARAREAMGALVLRMEDLDPDRSRAEYATAALEDLRWLGIDWQEGPDVGGPFVPYVQSHRIELYRSAWQKLLAGGFVYPCRCSRKDLAAALSAPHEGADPDDEPIYPGTCRALRAAESWTGESADRQSSSANWRFRVPDGEAIEFVDANLGPQRFVAGQDFGDFVVWRRDGMPSYQLACVVDDAAMQFAKSCAAPICANPPRVRFCSTAPSVSAIPPGSTAGWSRMHRASGSRSATTH